MGLFSSKSKPNPKILVQGIEIEFHIDHEWWSFIYRENDFRAFEHILALPTTAQLDRIINAIETLKPEINLRVKKGLAEWSEGARAGSGESYSINLQNYLEDGTFDLTVSDGSGWGDMGVDFTIKDTAIIDEGWGD